MDINRFNYKNLSPLLGQQFLAKDNANNQVELIFKEIVKSQHNTDIPGEAFSAYFDYEKGGIVEDGLYRIVHEELGEFDLCLSLKSDSVCEIVINRLEVN